MKSKPIFKATGILLALAFVLALLPASALCAPSASSGGGIGRDVYKVTPTPTPTPTPTGGGKVIPGEGKRPDVKPPGDGDGPGGGSGEGEQKPPPTPPVPPGKKPPTEPPIEIETPEDGSDADIKPKKDKRKEYEKQAVWTISFKQAAASSPNKHLPQGVYENYRLDFTAAKQAGDTMLGRYTGDGSLSSIADTSGLKAMYQGVLQQMDMAWEGPLSGIAFELVGSYAEEPSDELAPLVKVIEPLGPEDSQKPKLSGEANSSMAWASSLSQNFMEMQTDDYHIAGPMREAQPPTDLTYYIYAYPSGRAEISLYGTTAAKSYLTFWGTISKKINWKQVK